MSTFHVPVPATGYQEALKRVSAFHVLIAWAEAKPGRSWTAALTRNEVVIEIEEGVTRLAQLISTAQILSARIDVVGVEVVRMIERMAEVKERQATTVAQP